MATRLPFSGEQYWNACRRNAFRGAKMYTYEAGTTSVLKTTWTTADESIAHQNPIQADANGIFPEIYGNGAYYIEILNNAGDQIVYQADNIEGVGTLSISQFGSLQEAIDSNLQVGDFCETYEYNAGTGIGGAKYEVLSPGAITPDGYGDHLMANGNILRILEQKEIDLRQWGYADGDDTTDLLQAAVDKYDSDFSIKLRGSSCFLNDRVDVDGKSNFEFDFGSVFIGRNEGGSVGVNDFGLYFNNCTNGELRNLILNFDTSSLDGNQVATALSGCENIKYFDCDFSTCNSGVLGAGVSRSSNIEFNGLKANNPSGEGTLINGNNLLDYCNVGGKTTGVGVEHTVLGGECVGWTITDTVSIDTYNSSIYLKGSDHVISGNIVIRAGKGSIKILSDNLDGKNNIISSNICSGAGLIQGDGGVGIETRTSLTAISDNIIIMEDPSSIPSSSVIGIKASGSDTTISGNVIDGVNGALSTVGITIVHGGPTPYDVRNVECVGNTINNTFNGITFGRSNSTVLDSFSFSSNTISNANNGIFHAYTCNGGVNRISVIGNTIDTISNSGVFMAEVSYGFSLSNNTFSNITTYCYDHQSGMGIAKINDNSSDGTETQPVRRNGSPTPDVCIQENNSWQFVTIASGVPTNAFWPGNKIWYTDPINGGVAGQFCYSFGNTGGSFSDI